MGAGRVLVGGRAWAGAVATLLPIGALEVLCTPCEPPVGVPGSLLPPLERFLGCVYMRRHLQRFIQHEDVVTILFSLHTHFFTVLFHIFFDIISFHMSLVLNQELLYSELRL